ncbi:MAG: glycosyltransferase family 4 protein [Deltaproteobacteria bacterium]|nr:glycosyltransferase family 4 protein [Deltaproteobacteria bacterium]
MMESVAKETKKILILIEDGSYLLDNRVRREAATLTIAGYQVVVICPRYPGETSHDIHEKVHIYRYNKWTFGGHLGEYLSSLIKGGWRSLYVWKHHGRFDCIQACNPPDLWFLVTAFFKAFFGVKFVFDHHDVCPELFLSRFGKSKSSIGYRAMLLLEKLTFMLSDGVISTNESYKQIATKRGGISKEHVTVVRNGPDLNKFRLMAPDPDIKTRDRFLVGYVGNMNPQDGVEHLLLAAKKIIHDAGRKEVYFVLIGSGDSYEDLVAKKTAWKLDDHVWFTGRMHGEKMLRILSSCDIGVQPDPKNPFNDVSTMTKAMEYMALGKPVVAYDLIETRYSCGDCALYAVPNEVDDLVNKIMLLADNEKLRVEMGKKGRERVEQFLQWKYSERQLLDLYKMVFSTSSQSKAYDTKQ